MIAPNLSERITSQDCAGCGQCCEVFEIWYGDNSGALIRSEIQRFQMLAGIGDKITTRKEDGGEWLVFNFPCRHLTPDKTCAIHDSPDRPLICRYFPYASSTMDDCPKVRDR